MRMLNETTAQCEVCGCPIQHLSDNYGRIKGTLADALEAHRVLVHKNEPEVTDA